MLSHLQLSMVRVALVQSDGGAETLWIRKLGSVQRSPSSKRDINRLASRHTRRAHLPPWHRTAMITIPSRPHLQFLERLHFLLVHRSHELPCTNCLLASFLPNLSLHSTTGLYLTPLLRRQNATRLSKKVYQPHIPTKSRIYKHTLAELVDMLLDALIETHAWANARLKFENEIAAERFEQKMSGTMIMEKEQGMSSSLRSSLGNSVHRVVSLRICACGQCLPCSRSFYRENPGTVTCVCS